MKTDAKQVEPIQRGLALMRSNSARNSASVGLGSWGEKSGRVLDARNSGGIFAKSM
jgi:hypothetical protein